MLDNKIRGLVFKKIKPLFSVLHKSIHFIDAQVTNGHFFLSSHSRQIVYEFQYGSGCTINVGSG
ncbi:hypothetical protein SAMN03080594_10135 [Arenibacter palladensis]|uniref:Uncharacterized protein n=1 Tax=Arenibacter palladensis TaxID=237373 RepID=A0A1M4SUN5_9FLAO|nr:hypothetical protein SAMN03080594_10135 [Arenibacter palladensis]